jgi:unsaturated rhamnogalacturonyl hydrolase
MKSKLLGTTALVVLSALMASLFADEFSADSIKNIAKRCAKYRLSRGVNNLETTSYYLPDQHNWDIATFMTGIMALYRLTNEQWLLDSATKWSNNANWTPNGTSNATGDAQCCEQVFCEIYLVNKNASDLNKMAKPTLDNMKQMFDVNRSTGRKRWWWSEALYMSPVSVARVYESYKDVANSNVARLLDSVDVYWKDCAAYLLNNQYKLWWRDGTFKNSKSSNGSPVLWSCCNGWAIAGLARVLQDLPSEYKDRAYFVQQFKDVCDAIRKAPGLGSDGLWRTSLLDYNQYPDKESTASAFFGFAFTWGVNNGLLDKSIYEPYIRKTWSALVANIGSDGRLQWCAPVSSAPGGVSQSFSAAEGEGAFCLMSEELTKMLSPTSVNSMVRSAPVMNPAPKTISGRYDSRGRLITGTPRVGIYFEKHSAGKSVVIVHRSAMP